jgi:hypothetical protein
METQDKIESTKTQRKFIRRRYRGSEAASVGM